MIEKPRPWYANLSSVGPIIGAIITGIVAPVVLSMLDISNGAAPTNIPPTNIPPTNIPPTNIPPTNVPKLIPLIPSPYNVVISFVISTAFIIVIMEVTSRILKARGRYHTRERETEKGDDPYSFYSSISSLSNVIRGGDWYPSLSIFQFLLWTIVIIFAFLSIALIRIFSGNPEPFDPLQIPVNLFALFGISASSVMFSNAISRIKGIIIGRPPPLDFPPISTMLEEYGKITLTRLQMFWWTWIGIFIYLLVFFSQTVPMTGSPTPRSLANISVPDINIVFVVLMGLSQGVYIASKLMTPEIVRITEIRPNKGRGGQSITILGSNFGTDKEKVWFETGDKLRPSQYEITHWTDKGIEVQIPTDIIDGIYDIRIEKEGSLTYKHDQTKFTKLPDESPPTNL